jgi:hypothetical protein
MADKTMVLTAYRLFVLCSYLQTICVLAGPAAEKPIFSPFSLAILRLKDKMHIATALAQSQTGYV